MKKKVRKNKSILLRTFALGVCVYMIVTLTGLWKELNLKRTMYAELKNKYTTEKNDIDELKSLLNENSKSRIIEKAARERLGFVYPDEQVFIDISGS